MSQSSETVLSIEGLRKSFASTEVLHGVDLEIRTASFVGLMGPNGAGKSTLIKILDGVHSASAGTIRYRGDIVENLSDLAEVGFVHQDLGLVDDLSIIDNMRLGEPPIRLVGPILNKWRERDLAELALEPVQLDRSVDTLVGALSPGEKTLVAIARLLHRGAKVIFIDEATSTLPPADSKRLIDTVRRLIAEEGTTAIMVSHKLSEILEAADRSVLLIDGQITADLDSDQMTRDRLVSLLVSHETEEVSPHVVQRKPGEVALRLEGAVGGRAGPIDLELRAGQVTGVTGMPGSGLHDVAHLANGTLKPARGKVNRFGNETALVPPHRESEGGFEELSVRDNLTISALRRWTIPGGGVRKGRERADAKEAIDRLAVKPRDLEAEFGTLSGGNKQKVIFGRALLREPQVYVLCEPTRGVDLATRRAIYGLIDSLAERGSAVLVVSSDSEDLFAVCDRFAVLVDGELRAFIWADETDSQQLEALI